MRRIAIISIDLLIIYFSIIVSFLILKSEYLLNYSENIGAFFIVAPFIFPIYLAVAYVFGMMTLQRRSIQEIIYTILIVSIGLTISITASIFFIRDGAESYPRSVILLSALLYTILLIVWRIVNQKMYLKAHGKKKAYVYATQFESISYLLQNKFSNLYDFEIVDADKIQDFNHQNGKTYYDVFISDTVPEHIRKQIILSNNNTESKIYFMPTVVDILFIKSTMYPFDDMPLHLIRKLHLRPEEKAIKRFMDVVISSIVLILFLPILIVISIAVKLDGGPIIYKQERLTINRKKFFIYKFRSMRVNAESEIGPALCVKDDDRITRVGKIIRATRMDEFPQFFNILKGEMSLVGPRPERPFFTEKIENELPEFAYRLNVKAGLTGLAQVMGKYNTDFKKKLHYDLLYISNFSILKDFIIMLQTLKIVFWKDSVEGVSINKENQVTISE